jgi:hypothetical protein
MRSRFLPWLTLAVSIVAAPASAQDPPTRAADIAAAREAKAAAPEPYQPGAVERLLNMVESGGASRRILQPVNGFGVRIGGIPGGSSLAAGPIWRTRRPFPSAAELRASAAVSIGGDRQVEAGAVFGGPHLSATLQAAGTTLAGERFFGLGADTLRDDQTAFSTDERRFGAVLATEATPWLRLTGGAAALHTITADSQARGLPAISTRFTSDDAPGLGSDLAYRVFTAGAAVDYRDMPGNPRSGGRYELGVSRYADANANRFSFTRVDVELEQHLSAWKRQRVLTLRAVSSASFADRGHEVPFHLQRTLGGSRLLRGFVTDRFRDTNLLALQAEYGFDVLPFINTVLFYEAGAVAPRWQDLSIGNLQRDYGLGFRFGGARAVALRTDVAFGSGEGTRLTMRFNHAF